MADAFDSDAWFRALRALNPWAEGFDLPGVHKDLPAADADGFRQARKQAGVARFFAGRETWNAWAEGMLALKAQLVAAERFDLSVFGDGTTVEAAAWLALTCADFDDLGFVGDVDAQGYAFPGYASFDRAAFSGDASFNGAAFSGDASFRDAAFSGDASFRRAAFSGYASFDGAAFSGHASFDRAAFSGAASFALAAFTGAADFEEAA